MTDVFGGDAFWWLMAIAVGFPLLLVGLTELIGYLSRRKSPLTEPFRLLRNWVIPTGGLLALLAFALQSPADVVWVRVVATVFGFLVILLVLSSFNVALFANAQPGSWRERIPSIFVEIARLVLVVVGLAVLFSWVWGADVGGLFTALGVTSIVIGLALQNAVGGVISGLLLLFEQPFKIGDWLDTGGVRGRVVEVNWRAVHIQTGSGIQVVPNSTLSGASFTNLSEPAGSFSASTKLTFSTDDPPHEVLALLAVTADAVPLRVAEERSSISYSGAATYSVSIPVATPADESRALSLFLSWLWYAARRRGLALDGDSTDLLASPESLAAGVAQVEKTLHLRDADRERVLASSRLLRYGAGEQILAAGTTPGEVSIVLSGRASLSIAVDGAPVEFSTVGPGELIGGVALTGERSRSSATATEVLTVLAIPLDTLDAMVTSRPRLAAEIGQTLELERKLGAEALASVAR